MIKLSTKVTMPHFLLTMEVYTKTGNPASHVHNMRSEEVE